MKECTFKPERITAKINTTTNDISKLTVNQTTDTSVIGGGGVGNKKYEELYAKAKKQIDKTDKSK